MTKRLALLLVLLIVIGALGTGCRQRPLVEGMVIRPATISPNADGQEDVAEIKYTITRQADVSIYLLDAEGKRHDFRVNKRRSKGERTAYFGGVIDNRLLPDGTYTAVIEATDERGRTARAEAPITLIDGDREELRIEGLSIWPNKFTPNRDGITDRVTIGYNLSKEATRVEVYLLDADGRKYPVAEDRIREMGAPGVHEHDYDGGIDLGATPPKDGEYTVMVEAEDAVGNREWVSGTLTIEGGGVPRVSIVNRAAEIEPSVVPLGETLAFTVTVKNEGTVPVRTKGPESGTEYSSLENYNTLGEFEEPGLFRIGLDFEGNSAGRSYPYRWQLGTDEELTTIDTEIGPQKYLMPGQTVTVTGRLRIMEKTYTTDPYFWVGLLHEHVVIVQDRVDPIQVSIGF